MRLRFGYVEFTHKYQSSGAGGTRSPLATPHRLQNTKWPLGAAKCPTGSGQFFWTQNTFRSKKILNPISLTKICLTQNISHPNLDPKYFCAQYCFRPIIFWTNIFLDQTFLGPKTILYPVLFDQKFCWTKIFFNPKLWNQNYFGPKKTLGLKYLGIQN